MKKLIIGTLFCTSLFIPSTSVEAATQPKASCGDGNFTITNLPEDGRKVAIRFNDKANGWNLEKPLKGDFADKIAPRDGKFSTKATGGHTYDWWIHIENADGSFGSAIGGAIYCGAGAPATISASCRNNEITLSWKKVSSADHYAVRIDDAENAWDEKELQAGDTVRNNVKETKFASTAQIGHGYNVWVHAVDARGIFSPAKEAFVSCKKEQSLGFFNNLVSFFSGIFK